MLKQSLAGLGAVALVVVFALSALAADLPSERRAKKKADLQKVPHQAEEAVMEKNYDRAIELFTKAIDSRAFEDEPHTMGRLYFGRGSAYHYKEDCNSAVADYVKATEYLQKGDYYYSLASCQLVLKQDDQALVSLDKAIKIDPDAANYRSGRCKLLYNKRDYAAAIPDCEKALAASPKDTDLMIATAQSAEQTGNRPRAAQVYRQLLAADPGNTIASEGLARVES
jgi:tetratricopeptide (TPR) repeat protein